MKPAAGKPRRVQVLNTYEKMLKPASLPELVYKTIRSAIMNGIYKPGEMLRQEELAKSLGVSRAPLREALPKLEADGIVKLLPRRGYVVVSLEPEEIKEIFELRLLIEKHAATIATKLRTDQDVLRAKSIYEQMIALDINDPQQKAQWYALNSDFHEALLRPSGREHFMRAITSLRTAVEPYIRMEIDLTGDVEEANDEHQKMLSAFANQEVEKIQEYTEKHIKNTTKRLLSGLENKQQQA